jgi:thiol-disulfide isomerase/thioredoxin
MKGNLLLLLFALFSVASTAQDTYKIAIEIEGYEQPILSLANNVLDKQYIVDTAVVNEAGQYVFESDTNALPRGIYLVVLSPDNNYFQLMIGDDDDQEFTLSTKLESLKKVEVKGSKENELFYGYLGFLDQQTEKSVPFREKLADTGISEEDRLAVEKGMDAISAEVTAYQDELLENNPTSFVGAVISTNRPNTPPEYLDIPEGDDRNAAKLKWLQEHYLDPIDLKDERLLRTPFLFNRINYFVDKLFIPHPDTISQAIDAVLGRMDPKSEMFKYYVVHFLNKAASSKIVGMDGVYVHMVDNYYTNGRAYWAEGESLATMQENADKTRPLLIGKKAPNMKMQRRDSTPVELYDVKAKYTILYFWQFECGSCKKATPVMKAFYDKWKDKGVEIFSICTKQNEIDKCWEYVDEKQIGDWLHATDRYMRFYRDYDIRQTPTIFVLDENKEIVSKRIGADQLEGLIEALEKQKEAKESGKK